MNPAELYSRIDEAVRERNEAVRERNEAKLKVILCEMSPEDLARYHCFKHKKTREQRLEELVWLAKNALRHASFVKI